MPRINRASVGLGVFSGVIRGVECAFFSGVVMRSSGSSLRETIHTCIYIYLYIHTYSYLFMFVYLHVEIYIERERV